MCSRVATLTSAILYRVLEAVHDERRGDRSVRFVPWTSKPLNRMLMPACR